MSIKLISIMPLTIIFCGLMMSCGTKPKVSVLTTSYKVDSIVYDSSITYILSVNDSIKYYKNFKNNGNPGYEYCMVNDKVEGERIQYKNGYIYKKLAYKQDIPVLGYQYNWTGNRLDSVILFRCKYDPDSNWSEGVFLGRIIYKDGKIDLANSDSYTIDSYYHYPVLDSYGGEIIISVHTKPKEIIRFIWGILDSNHNKLMVSYDTISMNPIQPMIFYAEKKPEGLAAVEGVIEVLIKLPDDSAFLIAKRYPVYYPFYITNKEIEWYFGKRYYSINGFREKWIY